MSVNRSAAMSQSKLGGLSQSPLGTLDECLTELAEIINGHDPQDWTDLETQYLRDFIQGMWIAKALKEMKA